MPAGVDAKRKLSFSVCSSKAKRSLPSSSSHSSTEGTDTACETAIAEMEAMDEAIAEIDLGGAEIDDECGGDARLKREGGAGALGGWRGRGLSALKRRIWAKGEGRSTTPRRKPPEPQTLGCAEF